MHFFSPPYVSHVLQFTVTKVGKSVTKRSVRNIGIKVKYIYWRYIIMNSQATSHELRENHVGVMRNFYI
jgi:hypothetical protein